MTEKENDLEKETTLRASRAAFNRAHYAKLKVRRKASFVAALRQVQKVSKVTMRRKYYDILYPDGFLTDYDSTPPGWQKHKINSMRKAYESLNPGAKKATVSTLRTLIDWCEKDHNLYESCARDIEKYA